MASLYRCVEYHERKRAAMLAQEASGPGSDFEVADFKRLLTAHPGAYRWLLKRLAEEHRKSADDLTTGAREEDTDHGPE